MSIEVKKQAESEERVLLTGCIPFNVVSVNPTKAELEAMGYNVKEEPSYKNTKPDGTETLRIDFWLSNSMVTYTDENGDKVKLNKPFRVKGAYWLENSLRTAKTGKVKILNSHCQGKFPDIGTWAVSIEELQNNSKMEWFQKEGVRVAFTGEDELYKMIWKWIGFSSGNSEKGIPSDKLKLSKEVNQIISSGDVSELRELVKKCQDAGRGIKYLVGVETKEDGKRYNTIYSYFPMSTTMKNYDKLSEALAGEFNNFSKADYQDSFDIKLYTGKPTVVADKQEAANTGFKF